MEIIRYGDTSAGRVLIQLTEEHELEYLEGESAKIGETADDFCLTAVKVDNWNFDLSPWQAPAVFGNEDFGNGAAKTLETVLDICSDSSKKYYIGGYSLAGLFSLWAVYQTDVFSGVAAASPSMWFPGFIDYMKEHEIKTDKVYLSLGNKEEKTRNPVMATVGDRIREAEMLLKEQGTDCILEWNQGNHFRDPDIRTARAFSWLI